MRKPILSLDFDGVCHSYTSKWQGADVIPDPPVEGLWEFLKDAQVEFEVNIYSTRSNQIGGIEAMRAWFWKNIPRSPEYLDIVRELVFPTVKPPAFVGIDDRVVTFQGVWPKIDALLRFKPWNKRGI